MGAAHTSAPHDCRNENRRGAEEMGLTLPVAAGAATAATTGTATAAAASATTAAAAGATTTATTGAAAVTDEHCPAAVVDHDPHPIAETDVAAIRFTADIGPHQQVNGWVTPFNKWGAAAPESGAPGFGCRGPPPRRRQPNGARKAGDWQVCYHLDPWQSRRLTAWHARSTACASFESQSGIGAPHIRAGLPAGEWRSKTVMCTASRRGSRGSRSTTAAAAY
jgi:hypothetical protein